MFLFYIKCIFNLAEQMLNDTAFGSQAQKWIYAVVKTEMSEKNHKVSTKSQ